MLTDAELMEYINPRLSNRKDHNVVGYCISVPTMSRGRKCYSEYISINKYGRMAKTIALNNARKYYNQMLDNDLQFYLDGKNRACYHESLSIAKGYYVSVYNRNGFIEPKIRIAVKGFTKEYCCVMNFRGAIAASLHDYYKCVIHPNASSSSVAKFKATIMKRIPAIATVNTHTVAYGKKDNKQVRIIR